MKTVMLTGFEPFLDHPINPSEQLVKALHGEVINGMKIEGRILPVDFKSAGDQIVRLYDELQPDVVISLGLAAGRNRITPERVAININDAVPDNSGYRPVDEPIVVDGPAAYFSTLPIRRMIEAINESGMPADISNTAGTYLCNHVMYRMLYHIEQAGRSTPSGFVHIPATHELAMHKNYPSWSLDELNRGIRTLISTCV
jgi:pyroglutamyl-peptidase